MTTNKFDYIDVINKIKADPKIRRALTRKSFYWFFHWYFGTYLIYKTADFQKEMIELASDSSIGQMVVCAFRGSGKSTILTTALPIYAITGVMQKKLVVIVSQNQAQAQQHLKNIATEIQHNKLLRNDFWPYEFEQNQTGMSAITIKRFGARIIAISKEQSVRGLRHGSHRPDLIIADDVEDSRSVKTAKARNETWDWFTSEIIPLGNESTKYVVTGNLLHEDSLIMRLKAGIENGARQGVFKFYPLLNDSGKPLWPSRFPNQQAITGLEKRIANPIAFSREYLLRIIPDEDQIISKDDIHYYDQLSEAFPDYVIGTDLAISERSSGDYSAAVVLAKTGRKKDGSIKIYVQPNPMNKRQSFSETVDYIANIMAPIYNLPTILIEGAGMQIAIKELFDSKDIYSVIEPINGKSKRERLQMASYWIKTGTILFPTSGCEDLIQQIVGFGAEKHDDLLDAFTLAVIHFMSQPDPKEYTIRVI